MYLTILYKNYVKNVKFYFIIYIYILYSYASIAISNYFWIFIEGGRLESELRYSQQVLGESESVVHLLISQTAKTNTNIIPPPQIFHRKALLTHLKLLKAASHVTVNIFDV